MYRGSKVHESPEVCHNIFSKRKRSLEFIVHYQQLNTTNISNPFSLREIYGSSMDHTSQRYVDGP